MPSTPGLEALLHTSAFAPLPNLGWLRITGEDRVRWLNGMVTNSIQSLSAGQGCYTFFLSAQGRIQADATAFLLQDSVMLETSAPRLSALVELLDRFIIMDDVELQPIANAAGLLLAGPEAAKLLSAIGVTTEPLANPSLTHTIWNAAPLDIIHAYSPLVPRFELWSDPAAIGLLTEALRDAGAHAATPGAVEHLRLLEGTPLYGTDIRDKELPQETAQARALHFSKGCYLGQEIVERIHSRGSVHRTFSGFRLSGEPPATGAQLFLSTAPDKPIGELTSAASIPLAEGSITIALGYIRREALNQPILYAGGTATPSALPFL